MNGHTSAGIAAYGGRPDDDDDAVVQVPEADEARDHEDDGDPFDRRILVEADRSVARGKAAGRHRRHRVDQRIVRPHSGDEVGRRADRRLGAQRR